MQKKTLKIAHDFLSRLQASFSAVRKKKRHLKLDPSHLWFVKNRVSVVLDGADAVGYREMVDALLSEMSQARREVVSRRTVEGFLQAAIVGVASGRRTPETVRDAVETLRKEFHAPAVDWEMWCAVVDLVPPRRRRKFGRVSFQASTRVVPALTRHGKLFIQRVRDTEQQAGLKEIFKSEMSEIKGTLKGGVVASVIVQAVDEESAERLAIQEVRATLDGIAFFGSLLAPAAQVPSIDRRGERAGSPVLTLKDRKSGAWPRTQRSTGTALELEALFKKPAVRDLRISLVSTLLRKDSPTPSEERILTAVRWAGRAAGKARPSEQFLFYLIGLETLLLPAQKETELTYRMRLRAAHVLARTVKNRETIFKRIGQLYGTRSAIVHTGSQDVSIEDLSSARYLTLTAVLRCLRRLGREPDLESWFVRQALK